MKRLISLIALVIIAATSHASETLEQWQWMPGKCTTGVYPHPHAPFAVALFCEDALGTYMSVIHLGTIGAPATQNGRWRLEDRHWFDAQWGSDITGFRWTKDGMHIIVSTSEIYGSGGYFELDLRERTARQVLPKDRTVSVDHPGPGYNINGEQLEE